MDAERDREMLKRGEEGNVVRGVKSLCLEFSPRFAFFVVARGGVTESQRVGGGRGEGVGERRRKRRERYCYLFQRWEMTSILGEERSKGASRGGTGMQIRHFTIHVTERERERERERDREKFYLQSRSD